MTVKGIQPVLYLMNLSMGMVYMMGGMLADTPEKETSRLLMAIVLLLIAAMIRTNLDRKVD